MQNPLHLPCLGFFIVPGFKVAFLYNAFLFDLDIPPTPVPGIYVLKKLVLEAFAI